MIGGNRGEQRYFDRGRKKVRKGHFAGVQGGTVDLLGMDQQMGFVLGIALIGFKEDGFSRERHSLKAPKQSRPHLACQEFHRGANRTIQSCSYLGHPTNFCSY